VSSAHFSGPWDGTTKATFTVPSGTMCIDASASAYTTSTPNVLDVEMVDPGKPEAPHVSLQVEANEPNSHKALVSSGLACQPVGAGTYNFQPTVVGPTSSDSTDVGSVTIYQYK
jgi:hypothetical protein